MNDANNDCGDSSSPACRQGIYVCSQGRRFMPRPTTFGCLVALLLLAVSIVPRSVVAQEGGPFVPNRWGSAVARFVPWLPQTWIPRTIDVETEEFRAIRNRIRAGLERQRTPFSSIDFGRDDQRAYDRIVERNDFDDYTIYQLSREVGNGHCADTRFVRLDGYTAGRRMLRHDLASDNDTQQQLQVWERSGYQIEFELVGSHLTTRADATDCSRLYANWYIVLRQEAQMLVDRLQRLVEEERDVWVADQLQAPLRAANARADAKTRIEAVIDLLYGNADVRVVYYSCNNPGHRWLFARRPQRNTEEIWSDYVRASYAFDGQSRCRRFLDFETAYEDAASSQCQTKGRGCDYILDWHPDF